MTSSVQETLAQINKVLKESDHGPYSNYSCKTVSWDDVERGTVGGKLSCWGSNITDTRLYAKDGRQLFTVRGNNWNERLGKVKANDLALIATDTNGGGASSGLRPNTLQTVLSNISKFGEYANLKCDSLLDKNLDNEVSVRFQTTFLPVQQGEKQTLQFVPEAYNYNTMHDEDPRNLIFLCTTQGLAIQQDGKGAKELFHHAKNDSGKVVNRYWLEVESSSHKVGGSQVETKEEKEDAVKRGKATSAVIGTKAMGTRFNVLMTIQIPLQQQKSKQKQQQKTKVQQQKSKNQIKREIKERLRLEKERLNEKGSCADESFCSAQRKVKNWEISSERETLGRQQFIRRRSRKFTTLFEDTSSAARVSRGNFYDSWSGAARVSRGNFYDLWSGLSVQNPKRHKSEHITATIVMYYTCSGGVPSSADVKSAIDDLEELYQAIEVQGNLADETSFDFMKSELTVKDMMDIINKIKNQPPPKPSLPMDADIFPS